MELELTQSSEVKSSNLTQTNTTQTLDHFPPQEKPPHFPSITHLNPDSSTLHANLKTSPPDFTISSFPFGGIFPDFRLNGELSSNPSLCDDANKCHINHRNRFEHVSNVVDERRMRRMISNRESARRSRLRKKKQIEELQMQVDQLRDANNSLSQKLISLLESNHQIIQENAQLKERVSSLQVIVTDLLTPFKNV